MHSESFYFEYIRIAYYGLPAGCNLCTDTLSCLMVAQMLNGGFHCWLGFSLERTNLYHLTSNRQSLVKIL